MSAVGIVDRLAAAVSSYDRPSSAAITRELIAFARSEDGVDASTARRALHCLRKKRYFDLMLAAGDALIQAGQDDPSVRGLYAQALIDTGSVTAATSVLERLIDDCAGQPQAEAEARGLLGRAHKQSYVDGNGRSAVRRRSLLASALASYYSAYVASPGRNGWHGINSAALLARAGRDGVAIDGFPDGQRIARDVLNSVETADEQGNASGFDFATAAEACVALDRFDDALRYLNRYVEEKTTDAFEIASTLRQLEQVWGFQPGDGTPGSPLVVFLRAHLLRRQDGGSIDAQASTIGVPPADASVLQRVLGAESYVPLEWYAEGAERARAVARIGIHRTTGFGTGFVVSAGQLDETLQESWLLVTNEHVLSLDNRDALRPEQAVVTFEALDGGRETYRPSVLWSSRELDVTISRLDRDVTGIKPMPFAAALPLLDPPSRLYVIGHPLGGTLSFSLDDNVLLDHADPLVHYRTPTERGSSGSPVFNRQWELVALHHAGGTGMRRLHPVAGESETYPANEGFSFGAIRRAFQQRPR